MRTAGLGPSATQAALSRELDQRFDGPGAPVDQRHHRAWELFERNVVIDKNSRVERALGDDVDRANRKSAGE